MEQCSQMNCSDVGFCLRNEEVEAIGLYKALSWLRKLNVSNVCIELDWLPIVEVLIDSKMFTKNLGL